MAIFLGKGEGDKGGRVGIDEGGRKGRIDGGVVMEIILFPLGETAGELSCCCNFSRSF